MSHTNHAATAQSWLDHADSDRVMASPAGLAASNTMIARAQVHATLALAEQQRVANLIALGKAAIGGSLVLSQQIADDAATTLAEHHPHLDPDLGGWWQLRPDIARTLGINPTDTTTPGGPRG